MGTRSVTPPSVFRRSWDVIDGMRWTEQLLMTPRDGHAEHEELSTQVKRLRIELRELLERIKDLEYGQDVLAAELARRARGGA